MPFLRDSRTIAEFVTPDRRVQGTLLGEVLVDMRRSSVDVHRLRTSVFALHRPIDGLRCGGSA